MKLHNDIRANASTYLLLMFPLAFALTSVVVDVSGWNAFREGLQQHADRTALTAAAALPNEEFAIKIVSSQSELLGIPSLETHTKFINDTSDVRGSIIEVTLSATYEASFARLLAAEAEWSRFRASRSATAALIPVDTVIVFPDGHTMRPSIKHDNTLAEPWGAAGEWPASESFACYSPAAPPYDKERIVDWKSLYQSDYLRRWATQACFNPVFSAIKSSVIRISEESRLSGLSRVAVISSPGEKDQNGYFVLRHLSAGSNGGFRVRESGAESNFPDHHERQSGLTTESCIIFSMPPIAAVPAYYPSSVVTGRPINMPICGAPFPFNAQILPDYKSRSLTLKQAIYWLPAKLPSDDFSAEPDITSALEAALQEFLQRDTSTLSVESDVRRNLSGLTKRQVIAITDLLPDPSIVATVLDWLSNAQINVWIVPYAHSQLSTAEVSSLLARRDALKHLSRWPKLKWLNASSPEELENVITPLLITSTKEAVLRR